jgi:hypothetical protein
MIQTNTRKIQLFCYWDIGVLVIVSYFVLRISNFLTEKAEFSVKHYLPSKHNGKDPYSPTIGGKIVEMTLLNNSHEERQGRKTDQCGRCKS